MKELDLQKLSFDCQCPQCKTWWTCGKDDLRSKVETVEVSDWPGYLGSPTHPVNKVLYYVNCANAKCHAEIIVDHCVHPALKEWADEERQQK